MQENLSFPLRAALKWETQGGFVMLGTTGEKMSPYTLVIEDSRKIQVSKLPLDMKPVEIFLY